MSWLKGKRSSLKGKVVERRLESRESGEEWRVVGEMSGGFFYFYFEAK